METLCSLFAGCVSLTFINLLPSIAANGTPARCLPLGPRLLQPAVTQRWSWIKDKLFCSLSATTAHRGQCRVPTAGAAGLFPIPAGSRIPRDSRGLRGLRACGRALLPARPRPRASCAPCARAHGARNRACGGSGFLEEFREVQGVINSVLPSALWVFV